MNVLKSISVADVEWELICEPEQIDVADHFEDEQDIEWVQEQLANGNEWAWCHIRLVGHFRGLQCWDSLGANSYSSEAAFRADGYFADMQLEVLRQLQEAASNIADFFSDSD